jgi:hypothetical protein
VTQTKWPPTNPGRFSRVPDQGSRRTACLLRLPGRALEAFAHDQSDRKLVRNRPPPNGALQGMPLEQDRARHDLKLAEAAEKSWRRLDGHNQLGRAAGVVKLAAGCPAKPRHDSLDQFSRRPRQPRFGPWPVVNANCRPSAGKIKRLPVSIGEPKLVSDVSQ